MTQNYDLVLRAGRITCPEGVVEGDLAIHDGRIVAIGPVSGRGAREIDATGRWIMPGGVDPHAHIEQMSGMGLMNADTFETATRSAAIGGTTSVISFAAQKRGERPRDTVADYARRAARGAIIDHAFHITVADTDAPHFAADLADLIAAGHRSLKVFTTYDIGLDDSRILDVMRIARAHGALVCAHAENDAIIAQARKALLDAGATRPRDHARSRPRLAEIEAVQRLCCFAEHLNQPVMLFHISTAEAADELRRARARGAPVWAETCPHYLFMTEDVLDRPDGAKWMCSPPQRSAADQRALWQALGEGDLQVISSDHAPYRYDETGKLKAGPDAPFPLIANGLPGLETRLPLMFDAMMAGPDPDPVGFARLTAQAPADLYGLTTKGRIAAGFDADLVVWDPLATRTYGADDLHDNVRYNPWEGRQVTGWPETVILRGQVIVEGGECRARPGSGRWLSRDGLGEAVERRMRHDEP